MPIRIQRKRTMGWKKPEGSIYVGRPSVYGNIYKIGFPHPFEPRAMTRKDTVELFKKMLEQAISVNDYFVTRRLAALRGHDIICWCHVNHACHGDVWLELANKEPSGSS